VLLQNDCSRSKIGLKGLFGRSELSINNIRGDSYKDSRVPKTCDVALSVAIVAVIGLVYVVVFRDWIFRDNFIRVSVHRISRLATPVVTNL
jgi:hypothetical protein